MSELPDVYTDTEWDADSEQIKQQMREETEKAKKIHGAPTMQLGEVMLSIFVKPNTCI